MPTRAPIYSTLRRRPAVARVTRHRAPADPFWRACRLPRRCERNARIPEHNVDALLLPYGSGGGERCGFAAPTGDAVNQKTSPEAPPSRLVGTGGGTYGTAPLA